MLGLLWWSWVGYAWLTSVVDPDEGGVRLVLFAAMAALLVTSLCVPDAFGDLGLTLALAYGGVRAAHIALFVLASRDDPGLRHSVVGLAVSTAIGVGILVVGSFFDGRGPAVRCGPPRSCSTWPARCSSTRAAGGSSPVTSPSATASS